MLDILADVTNKCRAAVYTLGNLKMWLELTNSKGARTLISLSNVNYIIDRGKGGCTIYFGSERIDGTARAMAVQEQYEVVSKLISELNGAGKADKKVNAAA